METPNPQPPNPQPSAAAVPVAAQFLNSIQSKSNEDPSSKSESTSNPEPASKAPGSAPSPEVQATPLPAKPEPVQEHCLTCGAPLPPLLPTGERPEHYCTKCEHAVPVPPGTSIRQRCPTCWAYLPLEGYLIESNFSTCLKCGALLPKIRPPWAPPLPPHPAAA